MLLIFENNLLSGIKRLFWGAIAICSVFACSSEETYELGLNFVETSTRLVVCDTFSVVLSTIIADSIKTSGTETALCGGYSDSICGRISCSSYFQITIPSSFLVLEQEVYDSIIFYLTMNKYYYGDTTRFIRINVHKLTEDIDPGDNGTSIFNTRFFAYEPDPIGTLEFTPRPNGSDTIHIRFRDDLGQELFNILKEKNESMTSSEGFLNWFKGLALIPSENCNSILGFKANSENIYFTIYTHDKNDFENTKSYKFALTNTSYQFNHITLSKDNGFFKNLTSKLSALPSKISNDKTCLMGGTGVYTKIQFPTLDQYFIMEKTILLKAELFLRPANKLFNQFNLPDTLLLAEVNKYNEQSVLLRSDNSYFSGYLSDDKLYGENTYYYFDITDYLKEILSSGSFATEKGLSVRLPDEKEKKTVDRVIFETAAFKPSLRLYFARYLN